VGTNKQTEKKVYFHTSDAFAFACFLILADDGQIPAVLPLLTYCNMGCKYGRKKKLGWVFPNTGAGLRKGPFKVLYGKALHHGPTP